MPAFFPTWISPRAARAAGSRSTFCCCLLHLASGTGADHRGLRVHIHIRTVVAAIHFRHSLRLDRPACHGCGCQLDDVLAAGHELGAGAVANPADCPAHGGGHSRSAIGGVTGGKGLDQSLRQNQWRRGPIIADGGWPGLRLSRRDSITTRRHPGVWRLHQKAACVVPPRLAFCEGTGAVQWCRRSELVRVAGVRPPAAHLHDHSDGGPYGRSVLHPDPALTLDRTLRTVAVFVLPDCASGGRRIHLQESGAPRATWDCSRRPAR